MSQTTHQPTWALAMYSIAGATPFAGLMVNGQVLALTALKPWARTQGLFLSGCDTLHHCLQHWTHNLPTIETAATQVLESGWIALGDDLPVVDEAFLNICAPIPQPGQFFCSGANYRQHVIDLVIDQRRDPEWVHLDDDAIRVQAQQFMDQRAKGTPYIFTGVSSAITGPYDKVAVSGLEDQPDWELELAVVIGQPAFKLTLENAMDAVAGYTIVNDITNRNLTHRPDLHAIGSDWLMGKCQPGYSPMGPYLVAACEVANPHDLSIQLRLNNELMQDESSADMIFNIPQLLVYLTSRVHLYPGDVLITGSPAGNGSHYKRFLKAGDVIESTISGLGSQRNECVGG